MGQAKLQIDMTEGANGEVIVVDRPWSYVHSKSMRQADMTDRGVDNGRGHGRTEASP